MVCLIRTLATQLGQYDTSVKTIEVLKKDEEKPTSQGQFWYEERRVKTDVADETGGW